jgi:hypothetical protein
LYIAWKSSKLEKIVGFMMTQLTRDQEMEIIDQYFAARNRGESDESLKIIQRFPLAPHLALAAKEIFGIEYLQGWDLSEAEAKYGKNWLNQ